MTRLLHTEDFLLQAMEDASPVSWNLAHTTWFFEEFILQFFERDFKFHNKHYPFLFNSYYVQAGPRLTRNNRGLLSRPSIDQIRNYRENVDERINHLIESLNDEDLDSVYPLLLLGLNHEQQHQELMLTDTKFNLSVNPLRPAWFQNLPLLSKDAHNVATQWHYFDGGLVPIGHEGTFFAFDNETPHHEVRIYPFAVRNTLVTNREYIEFIEDDGYQRDELWLSDGIAACKSHGWKAPLYWEKLDGRWVHYTLGGMRPLHPNAPVCHVSHYEADAFATWAGKRLPTEFEWETVVRIQKEKPDSGNFYDENLLQPHPALRSEGVDQLFGDVWEWTSSSYLPYPRYKPAKGAVGEYNGKFMSGQMVLRGGSIATPRNHIRATYRNFFHPDKRWQFSGIRLADDA